MEKRPWTLSGLSSSSRSLFMRTVPTARTAAVMRRRAPATDAMTMPAMAPPLRPLLPPPGAEAAAEGAVVAPTARFGVAALVRPGAVWVARPPASCVDSEEAANPCPLRVAPTTALPATGASWRAAARRGVSTPSRATLFWLHVTSTFSMALSSTPRRFASRWRTSSSEGQPHTSNSTRLWVSNAKSATTNSPVPTTPKRPPPWVLKGSRSSSTNRSYAAPPSSSTATRIWNHRPSSRTGPRNSTSTATRTDRSAPALARGTGTRALRTSSRAPEFPPRRTA
mmetsp:Transcript_24837/g.69560  ORF Transcript_24837/g.69560 Transcript_24837/m.69560 type:complete len:282 (-) Transcript_24837:813-1658(-)